MRRGRIPLYLCLAALGGGGWSHYAVAAAPPQRVAAVQGSAKDVALEIRKQARGQIKSFYASRGFWPLWASTGRIGPEAGTLLGFLKSADLDGLEPYELNDLAEAMDAARTGDPGLIARAEIALSRAFARYVSDVRRPGREKIEYADPKLKPRKLRPAAVLRAAALPASFKDYVSSMGWMSPHYVRLRKLLAASRNKGASQEVLDRVRLNLDRARILPNAWTRHILVDAGSARLWYYQAGKQLGTMRVIVGAAETQTPMMAGNLRYAILNPYWNVPDYLTQKSIAPKILSGRTLASMRMEALSDWGASPRMLDPSTIDWTAVASGAQVIRLRQLPGGANSMGRVKFLFPNDEGIYLHDTPDRALFAKPDRHLSNGCIRLENAAVLGKWLLGKPIPPTNAQKPEQDVALPVPVPVYLTYFTTAETKKGGVEVLNDIYGRDGIATQSASRR
jgi:murein L,D-transpeptidase YcbB/YkuD